MVASAALLPLLVGWNPLLFASGTNDPVDAPSFKSVDETVNEGDSGISSVNCNFSGTPAATDYAVIFIGSPQNSGSWTLPTGWTCVEGGGSASTDGVLCHIDAGDADFDDPETVSLSSGTVSQMFCIAALFENVDEADPVPTANAASARDETGTTHTMEDLGSLASGEDSLEVHFISISGNVSFSTPSSLTERASWQGSDGDSGVNGTCENGTCRNHQVIMATRPVAAGTNPGEASWGTDGSNSSIAAVALQRETP